MPRSLLEFLKHIHEECCFIRKAVAEKSKDEFLGDEVLTRAVVRSLEIIGEATKRLPAEFTLQHPAIEWKKMAATRDVLIHDYFGVDYEIVWDILQEKIPALETYLAAVIRENRV